MEEKNNKKRRLLYAILGVIVLLASVGGAYAYFSASVSNSNTIGGNTQNINNDSLRLSVTKVNFNGIDTNVVPSNDLVPAFFGTTNNSLNVANPSRLDITNVQDMIENKCVNTSEGYTGCHVYKIAISANQDITHANLLLGLTVNNHNASGASVVDKSQWGYVVFTASDNNNGATGALGSGTQTNIANGLTTNLALNSANHGGPSAISNGVTGLDIHNNQKLIGCNSAGLPQEVVYYLLVYVNDTDVSQNTSTSGTGNSSYVVGSYSGTLELQALGGKVRACFTPSGSCDASQNDYLMSRAVYHQVDYDINDDGVVNDDDYDSDPEIGLFGKEYFQTSSIVNVYTVNHINVPANAAESWDVSEEQNGSVMAWLTIVSEPDDEDDDYCIFESYEPDNKSQTLYVNTHTKEDCENFLGNHSYNEEFICDYNDEEICYFKINYKYNLYIGQVGGVKANPDSSYLFSGFSSAEQIDLSNLDTSNVTDMFNMFYNCSSLTTLDLSNFDTSNVIDMVRMFYRCSSITSLDLSNFDITNLSYMYDMFSSMDNLTSITTKQEDEETFCDAIENSSFYPPVAAISINNGSRQCTGKEHELFSPIQPPPIINY